MFSDLFLRILPGYISFVWNYWGIQFLVLTNFAFQVFLTFNGSRRRYKPGCMLRFLVWISYLFSTKIATVVLGKFTTIDIVDEHRDTRKQVLMLLAPLMFVQIGNPDTITAYSLEDNQLGVRQVFGMGIQVSIMFYIIISSWTDSKVPFLYLPLSLAGIIKYGETSWALKSALSGNLVSTNADLSEIVNVDDLLKKFPSDKLPEAKFILIAYYRFCCLKPHLENWLYYPPIDCDQTNLGLSNCEYEEMFRITDCELGFMYDALYTKSPVIYSRIGLILRFISLLSLIATICGFSALFKDEFVYSIDVGFIYYVLIASLMIEIYQILRLPFTDWAIVQMIMYGTTCLGLLHSLGTQSATWRRWSNQMGQFNLLKFSLQTKYRNISRIKILQCWDMDMKLRKELSVDRIEVLREVKELVVTELKEIQEIKEQKEFDQRGKWTIDRYKTRLKLEDGSTLIKALETTVNKRAFSKSIFIWHITTNIFYHAKCFKDTAEGSQMDAIMSISNYMMYLMVTRSHVLSTTTGDIIFDHSSVELGRKVRTGDQKTEEEACDQLLNLQEKDIKPETEPRKQEGLESAEGCKRTYR